MVLLSFSHPLSVSRLLVLLLGTRYIDTVCGNRIDISYQYSFESRYRYVSIKSCIPINTCTRSHPVRREAFVVSGRGLGCLVPVYCDWVTEMV